MKKKEAKGGNEELQKLYNTPTHSPLQIKKRRKKKKKNPQNKRKEKQLVDCRLKKLRFTIPTKRRALEQEILKTKQIPYHCLHTTCNSEPGNEQQ